MTCLLKRYSVIACSAVARRNRLAGTKASREPSRRHREQVQGDDGPEFEIGLEGDGAALTAAGEGPRLAHRFPLPSA